MILDAVGENRGVQVEFYNRFQYTVEVSRRSVCFPRREDGPPKASLDGSSIFFFAVPLIK